MKKIFLFIFISLITLTGFGQSTFKRGIKVGNESTTATIDSIAKYGNIFKVYSEGTRIYDDLLLTTATPLSDVGFVHADTNKVAGKTELATMADILNAIFGGGGGGGIFDYLSGITGVTTGLPGSCDSLVINSNFIGKYTLVFRDGNYQQRHTDNTGTDGYWFDNATGKLTFKPVFADNEQLYILASNTILFNALIPEGGGGGGGDPPETPLLTNLRAYWKLDEVSGTLVNDSHTGGFNGTTNAAVGQSGKIGLSEYFDRDSERYAYFGTTVGDVGTSDFTLAAWIKPQQLNLLQGVAGNWGDYPYFYITLTASNNIKGVINLAGSNFEIYSNTTVTQIWIHVAIVADRDGNLTLYRNGVAQTDVDNISAHSAVNIANNNQFAIGRIGDYLVGYNFDGWIDEVYFGLRALSAGEIQELMTKTYPFN